MGMANGNFGVGGMYVNLGKAHRVGEVGRSWLLLMTTPGPSEACQGEPLVAKAAPQGPSVSICRKALKFAYR